MYVAVTEYSVLSLQTYKATS